MRTPGILIVGLVLAPCGWILDLTSTVAPNWRQLYNVAGESVSTVINQGIWDICKTFTTSSDETCNLRGTDQPYFNNQVVTVAQGMMVASLILTLVGLAVVTPAARCWTDKRPRWRLAGFGGLLIFCSGVLTIIPIAWYTHILTSLNTTTVFINPQQPDIRVGYCIVLGYIGGIMEVIGGLTLFVGICRCCGGRNRGEKPQTARPVQTSVRAPNPAPYPRTNIPSSVTRNNSSMPAYSRDSLDDDFDYPRAKSSKKGMDNPSFGARPYDADL
ncbi:claudin-23-like [Neoarius graeffei]|uniref:claudin-23-like n=1 Tax=Neoarius graeffei TaxID=443677 RepID=UPI00298CE5D7|nr:claudin-23-like [Neoarius graeffei]